MCWVSSLNPAYLLESEPGKGALFRVRVPAKMAEAGSTQATAEATPVVTGLAPGQRTRRILVVDDHAEILAVGCDDMVAKPFQEHEIFEVMSRFLDLEYNTFANFRLGIDAGPRYIKGLDNVPIN